MITQDIHFSALRFGIKGDNPAQIIKNMAWVICDDLHAHSVETHHQLDALLQKSIIGIGDGVGVFDWVSDKIDSPYILCARLENSVAFPSVDECPIDIILMLVSPEKNGPLHLQYLSRLTRMFREPKLLQSLRSVTSLDGMILILSPDHRRLLAA